MGSRVWVLGDLGKRDLWVSMASDADCGLRV